MNETKTNDKELTQTFPRFPDFGPLTIKDWKECFEKLKEFFNINWSKPFVHEEKLSDFEQIQLLGTGTFGDVILIKHKQSSEYSAMKAIEKQRIVRQKQIEHTQNEKLVLQSINFPLTVYLKYFFKDNKYIYMVLPFVSGGELFTHLKKFGKFEEHKAKFYSSQVILALEYLHFLDLIYRDLKPENVLIDHTGYLKLTDFGFCKCLTRNRTYTLCGTPEYLAPEVILGKGYGKAVDWWGIGIFIYELVAGYPPFYADQPMEIYEKIVAVNYKMPKSFSDELTQLVRSILQSDLSKRLGNMKSGVNGIKDHKWFKQTKWVSILNRTIIADYQPKYNNPGDTSNFEEFAWKPPRIPRENMYSQEFANF